MKWLETIELRLVGDRRAEVEKGLRELMTGTASGNEPKTVNIYCHATIETDYSIHLLYDSGNVDKNGSPLGLRLVSALKPFGLVNHNVWIEKN